jgi:type II secretory pathway component HofQ
VFAFYKNQLHKYLSAGLRKRKKKKERKKETGRERKRRKREKVREEREYEKKSDFFIEGNFYLYK